MYRSISLHGEHSSIECLSLDAFSPVAHQVVQTNDYTALTRAVQHACMALCVI